MKNVKVRRGWNNKLDRINSLLSYLYAEGLLNKTEMALKDKVFRTYYRYYNDGDTPRIKLPSNNIEVGLELAVEEVIVKLLNSKKYVANKVAIRKAWRDDKIQSLKNTAKRCLVEEYSPSGGLFWLKRLPSRLQNNFWLNMLDAADKSCEEVRKSNKEYRCWGYVSEDQIATYSEKDRQTLAALKLVCEQVAKEMEL